MDVIVFIIALGLFYRTTGREGETDLPPAGSFPGGHRGPRGPARLKQELHAGLPRG